MTTLPHVMVLLTVFGFMMTVVSLLPAIVRVYQERYKDRLTHTTRELDKFFVHVKAPYIVAGAVVLGGLLGVLTESWVLAVACALVGTLAPKILLSLWKDIRSTQFDAQLMDALILINNALRSGLDISTGIELIATNMKPPISEEFGLVLNAYRLGAPLETALVAMTDRIRSRSLETAVGAILMQRETGGNLIKTFEQLVVTIREESKLQKKVRAISSQGRAQISFLAVFPWALGGIFYLMSPEMFDPILQTSWGQIAVIVMVVWEAIGIVVAQRVVSVDV